ncbi:MAG: sulfite reductase, ferredoxin dependent [Pleurocapsa sp.]
MVQTPIEQKVSKVEKLKERSNFLREPLLSELQQDTTHFTEDAIQILKFHGSYQQDNRDNRLKGQEKDYQMMLRTRSPGGFVPPELFLALDRLSQEYGNHTLRVTTRQGFQIHGVLKQNIKKVIQTILQNMGSTLSACGDVNRNIMSPPAPFKNKPEYQYAFQYANNIADLLNPQSGGYYEIWLDGEKAISAEEAPEVKAARQSKGRGMIVENSPEPIYGEQFLPRKFKICVTVPGDNSVDVYTHDISLVVITNKKGELQGFNVLAGGGLGRTHNKEETFARISDEIGYVEKQDVYDLVKAIVATQRDYGDRFNRRHARMKYLINDWGVDKFKAKVESYFGKEFKPYKQLPAWQYQDFLGWYEQGDGKWFFGIGVENGRIKDEGAFQLKTALREIVQQLNVPMRLSPNHNVILCDIAPEDKKRVEDILVNRGIETDPQAIEPLTRYSMACPALPTCGLAVTESERALPGITDRIRTLLNKLGMADEHFVIRMTGCPNGCARPYMAELGFVGSAPGKYQIWLGGTPNQTQLAQPYEQKMSVEELETFFEPIFVFFKQNRQLTESFGSFCGRVGFSVIRHFSENYTIGSYMDTDTTKRKSRKNQRRVSVPDDVFPRLKEIAEKEGRPMNQIIADALTDYFTKSKKA